MHKIACYFLLVSLICACSPIDSVRPFDQQQIGMMFCNGWFNAKTTKKICICPDKAKEKGKSHASAKSYADIK